MFKYAHVSQRAFPARAAGRSSGDRDRRVFPAARCRSWSGGRGRCAPASRRCARGGRATPRRDAHPRRQVAPRESWNQFQQTKAAAPQRPPELSPARRRPARPSHSRTRRCPIRGFPPPPHSFLARTRLPCYTAPMNPARPCSPLAETGNLQPKPSRLHDWSRLASRRIGR